MAKFADYLISAIRTKGGIDYVAHIKDVVLHEDGEITFSAGKITPEEDVIELLKLGTSITTILWNYHTGVWEKGDPIKYFLVDNKDLIFTHQDDMRNNNLFKLINLDHLG